MAVLITKHVAVKGLAAAVPSQIQYNSQVEEKWGGGAIYSNNWGKTEKSSVGIRHFV